MTNKENIIPEKKAVIEYVGFKIKQYARITGFKLTQENIEEFKKTIQPKLKDWVAEGMSVNGII